MTRSYESPRRARLACSLLLVCSAAAAQAPVQPPPPAKPDVRAAAPAPKPPAPPTTPPAAPAADPDGGDPAAEATADPPRPPPPPEAVEVVKQALVRLTELAGSGQKPNPARLGLEAVPRPGELTVRNPFPEAVLLLEDLQAHARGRRIARPLKPQRRLIFPVEFRGKVQSSITLEWSEGAWRAVSYGSAPLIRAVLGAVAAATKYRPPNGPGPLHRDARARFTVVSVTGINLYLVAAEGPRGSYLIPLFTNTRLKLRRGVPEPSAELLRRLAPLAIGHNGLPT